MSLFVVVASLTAGGGGLAVAAVSLLAGRKAGRALLRQIDRANKAERDYFDLLTQVWQLDVRIQDADGSPLAQYAVPLSSGTPITAVSWDTTIPVPLQPARADRPMSLYVQTRRPYHGTVNGRDHPNG